MKAFQNGQNLRIQLTLEKNVPHLSIMPEHIIFTQVSMNKFTFFKQLLHYLKTKKTKKCPTN